MPIQPCFGSYFAHNSGAIVLLHGKYCKQKKERICLVVSINAGETGSGNADTIVDYSFIEDDKIDLSALIDIATGKSVTDYVEVTQNGSDITVREIPVTVYLIHALFLFRSRFFRSQNAASEIFRFLQDSGAGNGDVAMDIIFW